jgi:hypothetical protein
MANFAAFQPQGAPVNITVTASSGGSQVTGDNAIQYRFVNNGTNVIYWLAAQGALPTVTTSNGIAMLPNTVEVFTLSPNAFIATIAVATGNTLQVTPGEGV